MARWLRFASGGIALLGVSLGLGLAWLLNDRPDTAAIAPPVAAAWAPASEGAARPVTVTWLGVTTLLFDDGETRLLTDGFFSRPGLLDLALDRPVMPDEAGIDRALARAGIDRLAAILPVHSHYDHAMDAGAVALRTQAVVAGSRSTANAARASGLDDAHIRIVEDGSVERYGRFTVRWIQSRHMPATADGQPPMPGTIDAPLSLPAPITAWREGGSFSIVIEHPRGRALVHGSAGYVEAALEGVTADVVLLGIGGLARLGRDYTDDYWNETVGRTGAHRVFPVHYDDFTLPWGDVRPFPRIVDGLADSFGWLRENAGASRPRIELASLPFAEPVALY